MKLTVILFKLLLACFLLCATAFAQNDRRRHPSWSGSAAQSATEKQNSEGICTSEALTCSTDGSAGAGSSQLSEAPQGAEAVNDGGIREIRATILRDSRSSVAPVMGKNARTRSRRRRRTTHVLRDIPRHAHKGAKSVSR